MSPDTLATRLAELSEAGLVKRGTDGSVTLTPLGAELKPVLQGLARWADAWEAEIIAREQRGADSEGAP
jgi:DNA-binding HxlR family transcriptional regulator